LPSSSIRRSVFGVNTRSASECGLLPADRQESVNHRLFSAFDPFNRLNLPKFGQLGCLAVPTRSG
jgi:hypothetical protein